MPFVARTYVTVCENCPHKLETKDGVLTIFVCSQLKSTPTIAYNGILKQCPHNKEEKYLLPISDYVEKRRNK